VLFGTPIGNNLVLAVAWSVALALAGYLLARTAFNWNPVRS
jgi:ABC-2 type transport system permease protein